jgi:hypothetical protein
MLNLARTGVGIIAGSVVPLVWASESAGSLEAGLESLTIRGGADVLAVGSGHGGPGLILTLQQVIQPWSCSILTLTMLTCLPDCMFGLLCRCALARLLYMSLFQHM